MPLGLLRAEGVRKGSEALTIRMALEPCVAWWMVIDAWESAM